MPEGDLLIHCGDMFNLNENDQASLAEIDNWFGQQKFEQVLCIGGNHDLLLQAAVRKQTQPFKNAHYLQDASYTFSELCIYGSPWVPDLPFHAFSRDSDELARTWAKIPERTDILVTHTPPFGILDKSRRSHSHGCPILGNELDRIAPKVHCFGHVHASAGCTTVGRVRFINASSIESETGRILPPITFFLER
ncbi:MAG: metallophosphoesterase family protein [Parasphingorhabdus sp.]